MRAMLTFALVAAASLTSCQQQRVPEQKEQKIAQEAPPLHLGAVHQVFPEQNFALLRIIGPLPKTGTTVISHPADGSTSRIGNLVISSDQPARNSIIAADIRSGTVVKGDRIFQYRDILPPPAKNQEVDRQNTPLDSEQNSELDSPREPLSDIISPLQDTNNDIPNTDLPTTPQPQESIDVSVLPTDIPVREDTKQPSPISTEAPSHLKDIPTNINDWN